MSAAAPTMPPSSSAWQSIHLFGPCDISLNTKLSKKNTQRNHPQVTVRKISPNPCFLYRFQQWGKLEQHEVDKKYWKLADQTQPTCILDEITHLTTIIFRKVWLDRSHSMHFWYILAKLQHTEEFCRKLKKKSFAERVHLMIVKNRGAAEVRSLKQTTESWWMEILYSNLRSYPECRSS